MIPEDNRLTGKNRPQITCDKAFNGSVFVKLRFVYGHPKPQGLGLNATQEPPRDSNPSLRHCRVLKQGF